MKVRSSSPPPCSLSSPIRLLLNGLRSGPFRHHSKPIRDSAIAGKVFDCEGDVTAASPFLVASSGNLEVDEITLVTQQLTFVYYIK
jgi:hypothetical protein